MGILDSINSIRRRLSSRTVLIVLAAIAGAGVIVYFALGIGGGATSLGVTTSIGGINSEKPAITIMGEKGAVIAACSFGKNVIPKNPQCTWNVTGVDSNTTVKITKVDSLTSEFYISAAKVRTGQFTIVGNVGDGTRSITKEIVVNFNLKQEVASSALGISKVDIMYKNEALVDGEGIIFNSSDATTMDLSAVAYDTTGKESRDPIVYTWTINSLDGNTTLKTTPKDKNSQSISLVVAPKSKNNKKGNIRINLKVENQGKQKTYITDFTVTFSSFDIKLIYSFTNLNITYFSGLKDSANLKKDIGIMIDRIGGEIVANPQINTVYEDQLNELKRIGMTGIDKDILANENKLVDLAVTLQEKKKSGPLLNDDIGAFFNLWLQIYTEIDYMNS